MENDGLPPTISSVNANLTLSEIVTIAVVILIVFGPHRLPEMARKAGEIVGKLRDAAGTLRTEFSREFEGVAKPLQDIEADLRAAKDDLKSAMPDLTSFETPRPAASDATEPNGDKPTADEPVADDSESSNEGG